VDVGLLLSLVALALVDSTSVGTLVLPLWLMLAPGHVRVGRILTFLGAVAGSYLLIGVLLVLGVAELAGPLGAALDSTGGRVLQLVAGAVLLVLGLTVEPWTKAGKERRQAARAARGPGRLARWRDRARSEGRPAPWSPWPSSPSGSSPPRWSRTSPRSRCWRRPAWARCPPSASWPGTAW
jgi:hypothetical protein